MNLTNCYRSDRRVGPRIIKAYHKYKDSAYANLRVQVLRHLGSRCQHCGYNHDFRALQVDHVAGGGNAEKKDTGISTYELYLRVLTTIPGEVYQALCANCNVIKRHVNKEHGWIPKKRV